MLLYARRISYIDMNILGMYNIIKNRYMYTIVKHQVKNSNLGTEKSAVSCVTSNDVTAENAWQQVPTNQILKKHRRAEHSF